MLPNSANLNANIPKAFLKEVQFMEKYKDSLKNYIRRCFDQCQNDSEKSFVSKKLLSKIKIVTTQQGLSTFNWSAEPVVPRSEYWEKQEKLQRAESMSQKLPERQNSQNYEISGRSQPISRQNSAPFTHPPKNFNGKNHENHFQNGQNQRFQGQKQFNHQQQGFGQSQNGGFQKFGHQQGFKPPFDQRNMPPPPQFGAPQFQQMPQGQQPANDGKQSDGKAPPIQPFPYGFPPQGQYQMYPPFNQQFPQNGQAPQQPQFGQQFPQNSPNGQAPQQQQFGQQFPQNSPNGQAPQQQPRFGQQFPQNSPNGQAPQQQPQFGQQFPPNSPNGQAPQQQQQFGQQFPPNSPNGQPQFGQQFPPNGQAPQKPQFGQQFPPNSSAGQQQQQPHYGQQFTPNSQAPQQQPHYGQAMPQVQPSYGQPMSPGSPTQQTTAPQYGQVPQYQQMQPNSPTQQPSYGQMQQQYQQMQPSSPTQQQTPQNQYQPYGIASQQPKYGQMPPPSYGQSPPNGIPQYGQQPQGDQNLPYGKMPPNAVPQYGQAPPGDKNSPYGKIPLFAQPPQGDQDNPYGKSQNGVPQRGMPYGYQPYGQNQIPYGPMGDQQAPGEQKEQGGEGYKRRNPRFDFNQRNQKFDRQNKGKQFEGDSQGPPGEEPYQKSHNDRRNQNPRNPNQKKPFNRRDSFEDDKPEDEIDFESNEWGDFHHQKKKFKQEKYSGFPSKSRSKNDSEGRQRVLPLPMQLDEEQLNEMVEEKRIIGTNTNLEKEYLRLTSAVNNPEDFRPLEILKKSLSFCLSKYESSHDYEYIAEQLRSIRQDITVQHIEDEFVVEVYETQIHLAIDNNDWGNFNQVQGNLEDLYNKGYGKRENMEEMYCYHILYLCDFDDMTGFYQFIPRIDPALLDSPMISFAIDVWKAASAKNWLKFLDMMNKAPKQCSKIMQQKARFVKQYGLETIIRAFRQRPVECAQELLCFQTEEETIQYLKEKGVYDSFHD